MHTYFIPVQWRKAKAETETHLKLETYCTKRESTIQWRTYTFPTTEIVMSSQVTQDRAIHRHTHTTDIHIIVGFPFVLLYLSTCVTICMYIVCDASKLHNIIVDSCFWTAFMSQNKNKQRLGGKRTLLLSKRCASMSRIQMLLLYSCQRNEVAAISLLESRYERSNKNDFIWWI